MEFSDDGTPRISERETLKAVKNAVTDGKRVRNIRFDNLNCNAKFSADKKEIVLSREVADRLNTALAKSSLGIPLDFAEEYAFETLHHERLHAMAKGWRRDKPVYTDDYRVMEAVNQFCSRHSYQDTMRLFGLKPMHKDMVLTHGTSYANGVSNLRWMISESGIKEDDAVKSLRQILLKGRYNDMPQSVAEFLGIDRKVLDYIDYDGKKFISSFRGISLP